MQEVLLKSCIDCLNIERFRGAKIINIIGCIVIGSIVVAASKNVTMSPYMMLFLKAGFCGGFTTFSTFALETTDLIKTGHLGIAFLYVVLSMLGGIAVIFMVEIFK